MSEKLDAILDQLKLDASPEEREAALIRFMEKNGYVIIAVSEDQPQINPNNIVPGALYVDAIFDYPESEQLRWYQEVNPILKFKKDGGSFINDIPGLKKNFYIDTPKNRDYINNYLSKHPEVLPEKKLKKEKKRLPFFR